MLSFLSSPHPFMDENNNNMAHVVAVDNDDDIVRVHQRKSINHFSDDYFDFVVGCKWPFNCVSCSNLDAILHQADVLFAMPNRRHKAICSLWTQSGTTCTQSDSGRDKRFLNETAWIVLEFKIIFHPLMD